VLDEGAGKGGVLVLLGCKEGQRRAGEEKMSSGGRQEKALRGGQEPQEADRQGQAEGRPRRLAMGRGR
jgi:hypothetical protein